MYMKCVGVAVLLALVTMSSSCSLLFVQPVVSNVGGKAGRTCTESNVAPAFDTVFWVLEAARTGYALTLPDSAYQGQTLSRSGDIILGLAFTTLFAASSGYGFSSTAECRRINEQDEQEVRPRRRLRPVDLVPPPMPPAYAPPQTPDGGAAVGAQYAPEAGTAPAAPAPVAPPAPVRPAPPAVIRPAPPAVLQRADQE
jgi:hypothetical protein